MTRTALVSDDTRVPLTGNRHDNVCVTMIRSVPKETYACFNPATNRLSITTLPTSTVTTKRINDPEPLSQTMWTSKSPLMVVKERNSEPVIVPKSTSTFSVAFIELRC